MGGSGTAHEAKGTTDKPLPFVQEEGPSGTLLL